MSRRALLTSFTSAAWLAAWTAADAQRAPGTLPPDFDAYVANAMREWKVPGVAIAIVRNDSVVLAKGYGTRTIGKSEPVDAQTVFAIGSASKAFTATGVAMLVDEGKVSWDDPATKHLPGFQLYDPYVTRELTVRDLLSHRSGLSRGDLLWYGSTYDRAEILRRVRYLKPTWSFRSHFGYQNIMYLAAGEINAKVAGKSWDDVMRERIFVPLGMTASTTSTRPLAALSNVATPHQEIDDTVRAIPYRNIDNIAPAGSINSNVTDMAQWVRFQLNGGTVNGKPLVSAAALGETHKAHTVIAVEPPWSIFMPQAHFLNYGLGWFLNDHGGRKVVQHGGNIDGMSALVAFMPEEKTGLVILTNMNGTVLTYALMNRVFDAYLNAPPRDWSAEMRKTAEGLERQAEAAEQKRVAGRAKGTRPSLALASYAGVYSDSMYGDAEVRLEKDRLVLRTNPAFVGDLEHWHYDTFRARWRDRRAGQTFVTFAVGPDGKPSMLQAENLADYKRQMPRADSAPALAMSVEDLTKYTGLFESQAAALTVDVQLVGSTLKASVPGQPPYTLVPVSPTRFRLTGPADMPAGFFLDYTMDGGRVTTVTLVQPDPRPTLTLSPKRAGGQ